MIYTSKNVINGDKFIKIECILNKKKYLLNCADLNLDLIKLFSSILLIYEKLGLDPKKIIPDFKNLFLLDGRGKMIKNYLNKEITIIDDSYNASPDSMKSSLQHLAKIKKNYKRKIAILGGYVRIRQIF